MTQNNVTVHIQQGERSSHNTQPYQPVPTRGKSNSIYLFIYFLAKIPGILPMKLQGKSLLKQIIILKQILFEYFKDTH
jgi:hypothetical protein